MGKTKRTNQKRQNNHLETTSNPQGEQQEVTTLSQLKEWAKKEHKYNSSETRRQNSRGKGIASKTLNHNTWAVEATIKQKKALVSNFLNTDGSALHHKISKTTLESIGEFLEMDMSQNHLLDKEKDQELAAAAKRFWTLVQHATSKEVKQQCGGKVIKVLWNMPVNLEIGPLKIIDESGIGFDANTEPDKDSSIPGARKMDAVSTHLKNVEDIFFQRRDKGLEPEHWDSMTKELLKAFEAYGDKTELATPNTEQWVAGPHNNFQRKGMRRFLGETEGMQKFQRDREDNNAAKEIEDIGLEEIQPVKKTIGETNVLLKVVVTPKALEHFCTRHTYRYFNFNEIKAINTFWPEGTTINKMKEKLPSAMEHVATIAMEEIERSFQDLEEIGSGANLENLKDLHAANQTVGDETMFFIVGLQPLGTDEDQVNLYYWEATIKTMAADGATGEAYSADELEKIAEKLQISKSVTKSSSATNKEASRKVKGVSLPDGGKSAKNDEINTEYQYEDVDMWKILTLTFPDNNQQGVVIMPPTDNLYDNQLQEILKTDRAKNKDATKLLVPYNLGNYHWVGIYIEKQPDGWVNFTYMDPLFNKPKVPEYVQTELKIVYGKNKVKFVEKSYLTQTDNTSCGPITIHNLIALASNKNPTESTPKARDIRESHVQLVQEKEPGSDFKLRQQNNIRTISNFNMEEYLTMSNILKFSLQEYKNILQNVDQIKQLPLETLNLIMKAFSDLSQNSEKDAQVRLAQLREAFITAYEQQKESSDNQKKLHAILIALSIENKTLVEKRNKKIDLNNIHFRDFQELVEIGNLLGNPNNETMDEMKKKTKQQEDLKKLVDSLITQMRKKIQPSNQ